MMEGVQKIYQSFKKQYLTYCEAQQEQAILWFLFPLMTLSAAVMPIGFVLMWNYSWYLLYVLLSVLLFFGNITLNIAGQKTTIIISFYYITLAFHFVSICMSLFLCK